MMILRPLSLLGDAGKHQNGEGLACWGRNFDIHFAGAGGSNSKQVSCTVCDQEFIAWDTGLGPEPAIPARPRS